MRRIPWFLLAACAACAAQAPPGEKFVGTVREVAPPAGEALIQPDRGEAIRVTVGTESRIQLVAPGESDLRKAVAITLAEVAAGDRVSVALRPGTTQVQRLLVMPAAEIARRKEAERQDWIARGLSGMVVSTAAGSITLRLRSFGGERTATVTAAENTRIRRYAPDSVRFEDARPATLADISPGDQLRARGHKSGDGLTLAAEEIVFGTFQTRAGSITAFDAATRELTVLETGTRRVLRVRLTPDSQLKKMAGFEAPPPGRPPDFSQLLDGLPAATLEDLQPGTSILVSSTRGSDPSRLSAILLLAGAEMLLRMAAVPAAPPGEPRSDLGESFGGFDLTGMIPR